MKSIIVLVVAIALTNAFNLKAALTSEIAQVEQYFTETEPTLKQNQIPALCQQGADYAITIDKLDINPFPIELKKEETIAYQATGNRDVTLVSAKIVVKVKGFTVYKTTQKLDQPLEVKAGETKQGQISQDLSQIPFAINDLDIQISLLDNDGNTQYCGQEKVDIVKSTAEELLALKEGPQVSKCKDIDYEVSLEKYTVTPYPIPRGSKIVIDAVGVSKDDIQIKDLSVKYGLIPVADITYDKKCSAGVDCEFKDVESIPSEVPSFITHATLTSVIHDSNDNTVACYNVKVAFADAVAEEE